MARIHLDHVAHSYTGTPTDPSDWALREMDHVWEDGGAYALLGPSGCGKTTLLNTISGLIQPSRGRVRYDDADVTALPPQRRNIAQVFQFPVLYDTMTVGGNLAFPLKNRGYDRQAIRERVRHVAEILDLHDDLDRRADSLGAEAKQKISLGRGLVRPDVAAILFDEPLTVIDPQLKWHLRRKLKQVHEQTNSTLVYVTHDQNEALTFADRVAVMVDGQVVQVGTPQALFETPRHTFVGYFIGSPGMNLLPCRVANGEAVLDAGRVPLDAATAEAVHGHNTTLELGIRPEFVAFQPNGTEGLPVTVDAVEDLGTYRMLSLRLGGHPIKAKQDEFAPPPGESGRVVFPPEWIRLYADNVLVA
jgi:glycerol transport system ATP-binding protein